MTVASHARGTLGASRRRDRPRIEAYQAKCPPRVAMSAAQCVASRAGPAAAARVDARVDITVNRRKLRSRTRSMGQAGGCTGEPHRPGVLDIRNMA